MRRRLVPLAAAALLAVGALAVVTALRPVGTASRAEQASEIASELRCPDCAGLSVADSPTGAAAEIRRQIDAMLADGATPDEVRAHFVARYGEWIRLAPAAPWIWWLPFVALAGGAVALLAWLRARREGAGAPVAPTGALTMRDRERIHDEVEALDA